MTRVRAICGCVIGGLIAGVLLALAPPFGNVVIWLFLLVLLPVLAATLFPTYGLIAAIVINITMTGTMYGVSMLSFYQDFGSLPRSFFDVKNHVFSFGVAALAALIVGGLVKLNEVLD